MAIIMYQQALCITLERAINKALKLNKINIGATLERIAQKTLTIHLTEVGFPLSFTINDDPQSDKKIIVTTLTERTDCRLNTSIKTLLAIKNQASLTELIKQDKLDVEGDLKIAQQFASIAESLDIDWQTELAKHIGDVATHKIVSLGKVFANKMGFARQQIQADFSEYIIHEKRLAVTHSQLSQFNHQVQDLSSETQAISARIEQLANRLTSP